ncbi:hypothetical protein EDI_194840 [Entamoeba dispar SAW760]|uniref:Maelstrom domain-containing protein n=1 Tax=Entamoeba dispar (strain ATCC PRA-260 / SAW760) TaxID=370354 RepID=B0EET2_ENTDS|nr:uncharacterized protein EDI_194840 [Entamoeba dispar SAW760]EDR26965.1 hypothetical protein EDI_194840 [Entamoeba dispar SAW760]|eukprot:EDR26965.1 hypothetical protein EDI_194840 [Entamoeba dispar SAW760]
MSYNPRCLHVTSSPKQTKEVVKKNKKPNQTRNVKVNLLKELTQTLENGVFHFYDFEYAAQFSEKIFPIEIGISSYSLKENKEINSYHKLLYPGKFKNVFARTQMIHGIDARDPRLEQNYSLVCIELIKYIEQFPGLAFFVSKEESLAGDKKCIDEIFLRGNVPIPKQIRFITHIQLFDYWCSIQHIELHEKPSFILNHIFKQLECAERCEYHKKINQKYHCALSDARHTSLMELICMKSYGATIIGSETLPSVRFVKSTWTLKTNILFVNATSYPDGSPLEIAFTMFDLSQLQIIDQQVFYLQPFNDNIYYSPSGEIINDYFESHDLTNDLCIDKMNEYINFITKNKDTIVVCLVGKLTKLIPTLFITHFLSRSLVEFEKELLVKLAQQHLVVTPKVHIFQNVLKSITLKECDSCKLHMDTSEVCCLHSTYDFIQSIQYVIRHFFEAIQLCESKENIEESQVVKTRCAVIKSETKMVEDEEEGDTDDSQIKEIQNTETDKQQDEINELEKKIKKTKKARKTVKRNGLKSDSSTYASFHFE